MTILLNSSADARFSDFDEISLNLKGLEKINTLLFFWESKIVGVFRTLGCYRSDGRSLPWGHEKTADHCSFRKSP